MKQEQKEKLKEVLKRIARHPDHSLGIGDEMCVQIDEVFAEPAVLVEQNEKCPHANGRVGFCQICCITAHKEPSETEQAHSEKCICTLAQLGGLGRHVAGCPDRFKIVEPSKTERRTEQDLWEEIWDKAYQKGREDLKQELIQKFPDYQNPEFSKKDLKKAKYPATIELLASQVGWNNCLEAVKEMFKSI